MARKRARSLSAVPDSDEERAPRRRPSPPRPSLPRPSSTLVDNDDNDHPVVHSHAADEFIEGPNVQIIGETDPLDNDKDEDVPVRILTDFVVYDTKTLQLIPIAYLLELTLNPRASYSASGSVKAWIDHDDDDDDDEEDEENNEDEDQDRTNSGTSDSDRIQRLRLTPIKRFSFHDVKHDRRLDSNMYILTQHAWYILDLPSSLYKPFYTSFWLKHRILHLIVSSAISTPRLSYDNFIRDLDVTPTSPDDIAVALKVLGRSITEEDVQSDDVTSYLLATLEDLQTTEKINIRRSPVFRHLFGQQVSFGLQESTPPASSSRPRRSRASTSNANVELQVLEHRNKTVVTPVVSRVTKLLWDQNIKVASFTAQEDVEMDNAHSNHPSRVHLTNPSSVKWGPAADHPDHYLSARVDGMVYSVGDTVMVEPGIDENKARAKNYMYEPSQSTNKLANKYWFCRICYLFQDEQGNKMFHGQWFTHSSKTLLQELGHSQALYLMATDCEDININAIIQKCNVRELESDAPEPIDGNATEENDFFTGLMYNSANASLISISEEERMRALAHCDSHQQCLSCGLQEMKRSIAHSRPLPGGGFAQHEFSYHLRDFVYVKQKEPHTVFRIGQITKLSAMEVPVEVTVRLFGKYDDVVREVRKQDRHKLVPSDDRRLFRTNEVQVVHDEDLQGQCFVLHEHDGGTIDEWVKHDDHYYVNQKTASLNVKSLDDLETWPQSSFKCCDKCLVERQELLEQQSILLERHGRLRGLELFSGAGGLGTGFGLSGFVETRWAVEFSPSAARTYQQNHPDTIVYNQCTNLCLQHAIDTHEKMNPRPLLSLDDGKPLPAMPKPGEVDFIYGGPPCQSFSLMNHNKKEDDIRSTLVCGMLSYVEFYRPMYMLLENVFGILCHKQKTSSRKNGIEFAVVKFIQRALASIGYQCKFAVLQAAQYGAPQGRKRVIFWGARRDITMPEWPIPTHCPPEKVKLIRATLPTGTALPAIIRNKYEDALDDDRSAPLHFVSIDEAIGDLPPFDWINPHSTMKATAEDKRQARERKDVLKIPVFCPLETVKPPFVGYSQPRRYSSGPLTRYQKWVRQNPDGNANENLKYHYSRRFRHNVAERVCAVPLVAGANQFSLPAKLRMELSKKQHAEIKYASLYKRLDADNVFATALTTAAPNHKGGTVLHPSQKRIITIQECARAQGFPDYYEFLSSNDAPSKIVADQLRQIGNAVPVPLAYALGKSLGKALLKMWDENDREGSPEV